MIEKVYQTLLKVVFSIIRSESSLNPHLLKKKKRQEKEKKKRKTEKTEKEILLFFWG